MAETYQEQLDKANALHTQLTEMYETNKNSRTTAEEQTANLNKQSQEAYKQKQLETTKAQNQFAQNQSANQLSALDAIRRSNASAIANGANAGLSAANQLSSILGLQEETSDAATDIANTAIDDAAQLNTQLNENAATGQQMANELNATLDANAAELAKSLATNADTIAGLIKAERDEQQRQLDRESQERIAKIQAQENAEQEKLKLQQEADRKAELQQKRDNLTSNLSKLTANFQGGDAHTYVTSYYDPFNDRTVTTSNEDTRKRQVDDMINKLNLEITKAYDSGNQAEIDKWTARAERFANELKYKDDACLVPGTLITMADGTLKPVEEVRAGDVLLVWNMLDGRFDASPVLFVEHDTEAEAEVVCLHFSDNSTVEFVYEHGFFDADLGKYIYLHNIEEANKYLGHSFLRHIGAEHTKIKLKAVTSEKRVTTTHSPCTVRHLCVYANNILTMPGATEAFVNTFKVNKKNFAYDCADVNACLKKYGFFTAEDFAELLPEQIFYAFQGEYLKVKIGKGETSMEEIQKLIERYSQYLK